MKYGYARVSTAQQKKDGNSLEEQCNQLRQEGCDFIVEEQFTGARMDRPKFQRLCSLLEKGDTLVVCKLDPFDMEDWKPSAIFSDGSYIEF